jgi:hypothetical protein
MNKQARPLATPAERKKVVANTLDKLRLGNLKPSDRLLRKLNKYISGQTSTAQLLADVRLTSFKRGHL